MKKQLILTKGAFIFATLFTLLVCPGLYAAEETLPTPEEIIAKNIEAMGGRDARKNVYNIKTVSIRKHIPTNMEVKDTVYRERPNKFADFPDMGTMGKGRGGTNGKIAWIINPRDGARLLEGDELSNFLLATKFDGLDGPEVPNKSMKTESIEQINGKACYKVVKTPKKGKKEIVYYDKKSFLIVKTSRDDPQGNKHEVYFEDYKKINGILFAYKKVEFFNGQKFVENAIEKIELNIEMPEGIFDIPEEVKAIMNKK